jgi:hypothetical protein
VAAAATDADTTTAAAAATAAVAAASAADDVAAVAATGSPPPPVRSPYHALLTASKNTAPSRGRTPASKLFSRTFQKASMRSCMPKDSDTSFANFFTIERISSWINSLKVRYDFLTLFCLSEPRCSIGFYLPFLEYIRPYAAYMYMRRVSLFDLS